MMAPVSDQNIRQLADEVDVETRLAIGGCIPLLAAVLFVAVALFGALLLFFVILVVPTAPPGKFPELVGTLILGSGMGIGGFVAFVLTLRVIKRAP